MTRSSITHCHARSRMERERSCGLNPRLSGGNACMTFCVVLASRSQIRRKISLASISIHLSHRSEQRIGGTCHNPFEAEIMERARHSVKWMAKNGDFLYIRGSRTIELAPPERVCTGKIT